MVKGKSKELIVEYIKAFRINMAIQHIFTHKSAFINREKELMYLNHWVNSEPGDIFFLYMAPKAVEKRRC